MNELLKRKEIYDFVRKNADDYLDLIIRAIIDGVHSENKKLREEKNKVESGLVILSFVSKLSKLKKSFKETLLEAYKHCSFFKFDSCIKELKKELK